MFKVLFASALVILSSSAGFAAEDSTPARVLLSSSKIEIGSEDAILVRTAETPARVHIKMSIPYTRYVCVDYESREVYGPDPSCGTDTVCRNVCSSECEVWLNGECRASHQVCSEECSEVTRSCMHTETVCVRHDYVTSPETKSMSLKFKNVAPLATGEEETFELKGRQKAPTSYNDKYELTALNSKAPYSVKYTDFLGDRITIRGQ